MTSPTALSAALAERKAQRQRMQQRRDDAEAAHQSQKARSKAQEAAYRSLSEEALTLREQAQKALQQADEHDAQARLLRRKARLLRRAADGKAQTAHDNRPSHLPVIALPPSQTPPGAPREPAWRRRLRELPQDRYILTVDRTGFYAGREHVRGAPLRSRSGNVRSFATYVEALRHRRDLMMRARKYEHTSPVRVGDL